MKLPRSFYARSVLVVARECVGKLLVHRTPEGEAAGRIVEAEAYRGPLDLAAHSARGLTKRTAVMFGPPGYAYVYLIYGTSWAMNIIVASEGEPHGVLLRALEPVCGLDLMMRRRGGIAADARELTNGPGKLTQALGITGEDYGRDLCGEGVFLEEPGGATIAAAKVGRSARINVDYAGAWATKRWRFYERGNRYVSVRPRD
ncbi:MAG TPA: DNA-3-methyladenine glycosylase [Candidatus Binataceae bacterium]|nr:DNA-3-methyladenine glycosylase [Candidatus Binataceae bacterium]